MASYHMSIEVRGALKWPKHRLKGMLRDAETGKTLTADQARDALMDYLASGIETIPFGQCDNFDYGPGGGCKGHAEIKPNVEVS